MNLHLRLKYTDRQMAIISMLSMNLSCGTEVLANELQRLFTKPFSAKNAIAIIRSMEGKLARDGYLIITKAEKGRGKKATFHLVKNRR